MTGHLEFKSQDPLSNTATSQDSPKEQDNNLQCKNNNISDKVLTVRCYRSELLLMSGLKQFLFQL